jgi:hypothetical protein
VLSAAGCDDRGTTPAGRETPADTGAAPVDAVPPAEDVATQDAAPPDLDAAPAEDAAPALADAGRDAVDAGPVCPVIPPEPTGPDGPLPPAVSADRGVDAWERPAYVRLRDAVLADPEVHFVTTWDAENERFEVASRDAQFTFVIEDGPAGRGLRVDDGRLEDVFPRTDAAVFGDWDRLQAGYARGGGVLPHAEQSWPLPLLRLATLFDAPDAPDVVLGIHPGASPGAGTHGGLGLLQSRAALVLSGAGARRGVVLDEVPILPDIAPTVLAALGAPTIGGVGPDGTYADGLYLTRQDGRVLREALTDDPCDRPRHVVIALYDGLLADEINRHVLDPSDTPRLPTFHALAQAGTVYRHGAIAGFPSVSAPGHMTVGSGVWPGHHGLVANAFYGRSDRLTINPFALLDDPLRYLADPEAVWSLFERAAAPGFETLAQALHRSLGDYDPESGTGARVAVINELSLQGADFTTVDYLAAGVRKLSLGEYQIADNLAMLQIKQLLADASEPVPTLVQVAFLATDKAGETTGPHSETTGEVLDSLDRHLADLVRAYDRRGVLDRTLFILTADHGMEAQDPDRTARASARIAEAGVRVRFQGQGLIWLSTLRVAAAPDGEGLWVEVTDHDDDMPVGGATVRCDGCTLAEVATDADGRVRVVPGSDAVTLEVSHPDFNPQRLRWPAAE